MKMKRIGLRLVAATLAAACFAGCGTKDAMQNEIELKSPVEAVGSPSQSKYFSNPKATVSMRPPVTKWM